MGGKAAPRALLSPAKITPTTGRIQVKVVLSMPGGGEGATAAAAGLAGDGEPFCVKVTNPLSAAALNALPMAFICFAAWLNLHSAADRLHNPWIY